MGIIKRENIVTKDAEKALDPIIKKLVEAKAATDKLIESSVNLQKALVSVKKTNDGTEAKKLVDINNQLTKTNLRLKDAKTASMRASEQLLKANAKLAQSQTKEAQQVALVNEKIRRQNKILRDNAKATLGVQKRIGTFTKQILGAAGLLGGMNAIVNVFRNATKTFITFDKSASRLASILGKTKKEISTLTKQAKDLGAATAYTASQVISLQTELAKLGFTIPQIEASTKGILNLAAATGQDLASSAELAGATLRIFNLDASEMGRVTDVLAKSTTISSLSMEKLATIMPTVGKTAQLAGVSLEETAALAGTLTDRGLDASTAATSLRNIFLELSKKGITWEQAMQKINTSTDKNKTAMDLFGKRAAAAGAILAETSGDTDKLTQSLESAQGAAQEMADTMLDNLAGDMTKAQGAWEELILSLEDGEGVFSRIARNVTQFFTGLLQALKNANEESVKLDDFSKKYLGYTDRENKLLKAQQAELQGITDKQKQHQRALEIYARLEKERAKASMLALRYSQEGDTRRAAAAQAELDIRLKLLENVKQYIPELRKETGQIKENNTTTEINNSKRDKNSKNIDKQYESLKKLNDELSRQAEFQAKADRDALGLTEGAQDDRITAGAIDASALVNSASKGVVDAQEKAYQKSIDLAKNAANKIIDIEKEKQDARKQLEETFLNETAKYASDIASQIAEDKKNKELNRIEAEKDALEDQLDKGLINEIQYQTKLAELNKQQRIAEARAEKRKALYEIAVNTAVAFVKALPNLVRAGVAAAQGALQAAFVAARPLPKFAEGEVNISGKRHSEGGILAEIEGGESVINRTGTANAPGLLEGINKGLITDSNIGLKKGQRDNLLAGLLMQNNKLNEQMITIMGNSVWQYELDGKKITVWGDGSRINKQ